MWQTGSSSFNLKHPRRQLRTAWQVSAIVAVPYTFSCEEKSLWGFSPAWLFCPTCCVLWPPSIHGFSTKLGSFIRTERFAAGATATTAYAVNSSVFPSSAGFCTAAMYLFDRLMSLDQKPHVSVYFPGLVKYKGAFVWDRSFVMPLTAGYLPYPFTLNTYRNAGGSCALALHAHAAAASYNVHACCSFPTNACNKRHVPVACAPYFIRAPWW